MSITILGAAPSLTVESDLGAIWLTRDGQQVRIDPEEVPAAVAALLAEADRLEDAR